MEVQEIDPKSMTYKIERETLATLLGEYRKYIHILFIFIYICYHKPKENHLYIDLVMSF